MNVLIKKKPNYILKGIIWFYIILSFFKNNSLLNVIAYCLILDDTDGLQ